MYSKFFGGHYCNINVYIFLISCRYITSEKFIIEPDNGRQAKLLVIDRVTQDIFLQGWYGLDAHIYIQTYTYKPTHIHTRTHTHIYISLIIIVIFQIVNMKALVAEYWIYTDKLYLYTCVCILICTDTYVFVVKLILYL